MRINILQGAFLPVPARLGGAIERSWDRLGREFARRGHEVTHVSKLDSSSKREEKIEEVRHLRVKGARAVRNPWILKMLELPYVIRAGRILPEADVTITHAFWAPFLLSKKKVGKLYVHIGRYPKGQMKFYHAASRLQVPSQAIGRAVSEELKDTEERIRVQPYPLSWQIPQVKPLESRSPSALYLGRIHPEKGVLELVKAWAKLATEERGIWKLRIRGPWREEQGGGGQAYLRLIEKEMAGIGKSVSILDPTYNQEELIKELGNARIFIYPSLAERGETFGLAILEAMSCGCVPVVSKLDCFRDFLENGKQGFTFDHTDENAVSALAKILSCVFSKQYDLSELSESARRKAELFELERVASGYLEDFEELLNS